MIYNNNNPIWDKIFKECCSLKDFSIFVLPNTSTYINLNNILNYQLRNIFMRHKTNIHLTLKILNKKTNYLSRKHILISPYALSNYLANILINDNIVFMTINNYSHKYGYLIIPD